MKETNLQLIYDTADSIVFETDPTISEFVSHNLLCYILTNIYLNTEFSKALTIHVKDEMTIITTETAVSMIWEESSTRYQLRQPIVLYEDLVDDLESILSCIDLCTNRLLDQ